MNSRALRIGVGAAISVALLYLAVRDVDWSKVAAALREANYLFLIPLALTTYATLYVRAQRWRVFLKPLGAPEMRTLIAATNIGFMANMVLPLRIGEVIRPALVSRKEKMPLGGVLATILLERIFDMFCVLLLFGVSMLLVTVSDRAKGWGETLTGLAVVVAAAIVVLRWQEDLVLRLVHALCARLPERVGQGVESLAAGFVKALEVLNSPAEFFRAFAWSLYLWLVIGAVNAFGLAAFGLPLESTLVVTAIVAIAVSVPSGPGYIGSFQLGCMVALAIFGVSESDALAFSLVHHVTQFVTIVGLGIYSLWSENMQFSELQSKQESASHE